MWAVIAPPPTPNGDLHLGHLSGPYLAADVFARHRRLSDERVWAAISVDKHQSYVVTTAERLGLAPRDLCERSLAEIRRTLAQGAIAFDVVGCPDASYASYVADWFERLYASGAISRAQVALPYSLSKQRYLFESYAEGWCPSCLSRTCANICEACGHPNSADELVAQPSEGSDDVVRREATEFQLDLNRYRDRIAALLSRLHLRPTAARLAQDLLSRELKPFPLTFPSGWGLACPFPDGEGLVLNVWAEMLPGHYYWLRQAMKLARGDALERPGLGYAQFLGFDNFFFYAIVHTALAFAAEDAGLEALLPDAVITNEFYNLREGKFSTSQRRLIWATDFLAGHDLDEVRFFLAWSNPELQQSVFDEKEYESVVARMFRAPLAEILAHAAGGGRPGSGPSCVAATLTERFDACYSLERFSLREAARTLANGLAFVAGELRRGERVEALRPVIAALAAGAAPLTPRSAEDLWAACGEAFPSQIAAAGR